MKESLLPQPFWRKNSAPFSIFQTFQRLFHLCSISPVVVYSLLLCYQTLLFRKKWYTFEWEPLDRTTVIETQTANWNRRNNYG